MKETSHSHCSFQAIFANKIIEQTSVRFLGSGCSSSSSCDWQPVYPHSVQFSSVAQSCLTFCDPMNCSMPGLPVHHQLLEFTQTHVHWVCDAIQPSHPLSSPSPPAPNPSQHQSFPMSQLFAWGGQSSGASALASFLPKKSQVDLLQNGLVGSPCITLIKMLTKIQDCKLEIPISCYILSIFFVFLLRSHFFYLIWTHIQIYILVWQCLFRPLDFFTVPQTSYLKTLMEL